MKNSKSTVSMFILLLVSCIGVNAQSREPYRSTDRQVGIVLRRLERSTNRFRSSLNLALVQGRIDQTRPQNDINSFEPALGVAIDQFRDRFTRRLAGADDAQNILQKALPVNGFMARNRLNTGVQKDWASVRTDLSALANAYGLGWHWNARVLPLVDSNQSRSELPDSELNQLIQRVETGENTFRASLTEAFSQSRYDRTTNEANMINAVREFKVATDQLRRQFDARQPVVNQVGRMLARATPIDSYMRSNHLTNEAQNDWSTLRGDLNTLGGAFNLAGSWENNAFPQTVRNNRLTGTFRLDSSRSDNARDRADQATRNLADNERQVVYDRILARLESPEILAIERRGPTVTMASSLAPQTTFEADAREREEKVGNRRSTRVTATLRGEQLIISSNGYKENDFNVTFDATQNDRSLRVRRQIYSDQLTQPVVVDSVYDRTSDAAQWTIYQNADPVLHSTDRDTGEFIVRAGETVVAVLVNDLSTKQTKQGDAFTMTVRGPTQYEGAIIEGRVGSVNASGRVTGRSAMSLNFETIRLRNGQTYKFAGILGSVRKLNGDEVMVDNEGSAKGDSQTSQTIERTAIGTAVGAIIGAIAASGKGAVIGAVVGASGGVGSVYVQGKDNLELPSGTELTIQASAPR